MNANLQTWTPTPIEDLLNIAHDEARSLVLQTVSACRSQELRDIATFASDEVVMPMDGGPFQGLPYNPDNQPYNRLLFRELSYGLWSEFFIAGPSQSGKTLSAFVIPLVYVIAELRRNCVVGVPDEKMINDKWKVDILPVMEASPNLVKLLPTSGPGSKGGTVKEFVEFENGVACKFITRGGSDQSKAGFTASHVVMTEAAGWSKRSENSKEATPLQQVRARQRATSRFDDDGNVSRERQLVCEGTVTDEHDLPLSAREHSSNSRIVCPCVHCEEWVSPEREHFVGWDAAKTELEAARKGYFHCPSCGEAYTEDHRRAMNQRCELIHEGQTIDKDGTISGEPPETATLFFRWSAWNNLFVKMADLAADEWKAAQHEEGTPEREEAEKELCQQVWAIGYSPKMVEHAPLNRVAIRRRRLDLPPGLAPSDTSKLAWGIDIGKWRCWYFALAARENNALHCPLYGSMETGLAEENAKSKFHEHVAIKTAINRIMDLIENGLPLAAGGVREHDIALFDSGYFPDAVWEVVKGRRNPKYRTALGRGRTQMDARRYDAPSKTSSIVRKIGSRWHLEYDRARGGFRVVFDADDAKLAIQACLRVDVGEPGSLTLPMAPERDHALVSRHLAAEVFKRWIEPGKGIKQEFIPTGQNHLLDCAAMAFKGLQILGWKLPDHLTADVPPTLDAASTPTLHIPPPKQPRGVAPKRPSWLQPGS